MSSHPQNPASQRTPRRMLAAYLWAALVLVLTSAVPALAQSTAANSQTYIKGDPAAPTLRAVVSVDRTQLTVAEQLSLRIEVDTPADRTLSLPKLENAFDGWTIASSQSRESFESTPPRKRVVLSIVLEPFLAGDKTIPSLTFDLSAGRSGEKPERLSTTAVPITVSSALPKDEPDTDPLAAPTAKPLSPMSLPPSDDARLKWAAIGAGSAFALTLIALGVRAWIRRPRPSVDPAILALVELSRIREQLPSQSAAPDHRTTAAAISENFRTVLGARLGLASAVQTSPELSHHLSGDASVPEPVQIEAKAVLRELDLLVFSDRSADHSRVASLADRAESIARIYSQPAEVRR